ncbi:MAG: hypothetical protein AB1779_07295 [Candidatus Thermoplasmatota archaeon]
MPTYQHPLPSASRSKIETGIKYTKYGIIFLMVSIILAPILGTDFGTALIGTVVIFTGRKAFSATHQKIVTVGLVLFLFIAAFCTIPSLILKDILFPPTTWDVGGYVMSWIYAILLRFAILSAIGGIGYVLMVYCLEDAIGKKILLIAYIVGVITALITIALVLLIAPTIAKEISEDIESEWEESKGKFVDGVQIVEEKVIDSKEIGKKLTEKLLPFNLFSILPSILYLIAYYIPYKRIANRNRPKIAAPP